MYQPFVPSRPKQGNLGSRAGGSAGPELRISVRYTKLRYTNKQAPRKVKRCCGVKVVEEECQVQYTCGPARILPQNDCPGMPRVLSNTRAPWPTQSPCRLLRVRWTLKQEKELHGGAKARTRE